MPSMKLTKSAVDSARPSTTDYELRDTIVPGFFCKITPAGRKPALDKIKVADVKRPDVADLVDRL